MRVPGRPLDFKSAGLLFVLSTDRLGVRPPGTHLLLDGAEARVKRSGIRACSAAHPETCAESAGSLAITKPPVGHVSGGGPRRSPWRRSPLIRCFLWRRSAIRRSQLIRMGSQASRVLRTSNRSVAPRRTITKRRMSSDIRPLPLSAVHQHARGAVPRGRSGHRRTTCSWQPSASRRRTPRARHGSCCARPAGPGPVLSEQPLCQRRDSPRPPMELEISGPEPQGGLSRIHW